MGVQEQVIELIRSQIGGGSEASFDHDLLERMGELLVVFAEPGFETTMLGASTTGGDVRNSGAGVEGLQDVVGDWLDTFADLRAEQIEVSRVGDSVVMSVLQIATVQGVEISTPSAIVLKFRGEKVAEVEFYLDQGEARASALAGLPGEP